MADEPKNPQKVFVVLEADGSLLDASEVRGYAENSCLRPTDRIVSYVPESEVTRLREAMEKAIARMLTSAVRPHAMNLAVQILTEALAPLSPSEEQKV